MSRDRHGRTLVEDVYTSIKTDILLGRLQPGQRLRLSALRAEHNVSLSVVREAIVRLGGEYLVESRPQQGFRVRELSVPDLLDLTRVRVEIESMVLRESVANGDVAWEADLIASHHRLVAVADRQPEPDPVTMGAHSDFHAALAAACSSPLLKKMRQQLFDAAELYRYWALTLGSASQKRDPAAEHRAILDAALGREVERCVDLSAQHIQLTTDLLLENQNLPPEPGGRPEFSSSR